MEKPRIVTAIGSQEDRGRTTPRLLVRGDDGNDYFAKPSHDHRAINYENQLRGWVGTQVARRLGLNCLPDVVALVRLDVDIEFVLGSRRLPGKVDYHEASEDQRATIANPGDIPRIVFLDLLLLNSDRKEHNSNLVISDRRLYIIDLDNFFTNAPKFVEGSYRTPRIRRVKNATTTAAPQQSYQQARTLPWGTRRAGKREGAQNNARTIEPRSGSMAAERVIQIAS